MGDGAELDKTRTKFTILKFFLDERRESPCLKIAALKPAVGGVARRYGDGISITPEYKPLDAGCRSLHAQGASSHKKALLNEDAQV